MRLERLDFGLSRWVVDVSHSSGFTEYAKYSFVHKRRIVDVCYSLQLDPTKVTGAIGDWCWNVVA